MASSKHPKGEAKVQCGHWCERSTKGRRYVNARWQCSRETWHPSGYCAAHRFEWRKPRNEKKEPTDGE